MINCPTAQSFTGEGGMVQCCGERGGGERGPLTDRRVEDYRVQVSEAERAQEWKRERGSRKGAGVEATCMATRRWGKGTDRL